MSLSDEDKAEMTGLFADAFLAGMNKWRSQLEEEEAKKGSQETGQQNTGQQNKGEVKRGGLAGFILGE